MCDPCVLWSLVGGGPGLCCRNDETQICQQLMLCSRKITSQAPCQQSSVAPPGQEKLQVACAGNRVASAKVLGVARPLQLRNSRGGLRARPHAFRLTTEKNVEPIVDSSAPITTKLTSRAHSLPATEDPTSRPGGFRCTSATSSRSPSPWREVTEQDAAGLATAPLLAVDSEAPNGASTGDALAKCQQQRESGRRSARSLASSLQRRRQRRRRSSRVRRASQGSLASAPSQCDTLEDDAESWVSVAAGAQMTEKLLACQGYKYNAGAWDWPLSRLEKKARLLMLDRQVLLADYEDLASKLDRLQHQD
eukprot:TRINITY_DN44428_c0_g1_i1.p1 TRINITY_DN44428_c0_g1~~TRINITY_DN44428_c0_g1_i1.p1  ORF type:complete len:307 (-),score=43.45 TRINITY_DN44428_c0_g1_i1:69-989(-)